MDDETELRLRCLEAASASHGPAPGESSDRCFTARAEHFVAWVYGGAEGVVPGASPMIEDHAFEAAAVGPLVTPPWCIANVGVEPEFVACGRPQDDHVHQPGDVTISTPWQYRFPVGCSIRALIDGTVLDGEDVRYQVGSTRGRVTKHIGDTDAVDQYRLEVEWYNTGKPPGVAVTAQIPLRCLDVEIIRWCDEHEQPWWFCRNTEHTARLPVADGGRLIIPIDCVAPPGAVPPGELLGVDETKRTHQVKVAPQAIVDHVRSLDRQLADIAATSALPGYSDWLVEQGHWLRYAADLIELNDCGGADELVEATAIIAVFDEVGADGRSIRRNALHEIDGVVPWQVPVKTPEFGEPPLGMLQVNYAKLDEPGPREILVATGQVPRRALGQYLGLDVVNTRWLDVASNGGSPQRALTAGELRSLTTSAGLSPAWLSCTPLTAVNT